jgi:5'-nucleotidase
MTDVDATVQAVNEYGLSPERSFGLLVAPKTKASSHLKSVQLLQFSEFHGALVGTSSIFGADGLAGQFALKRTIVPATIALSSGDNFGAAPPISSQFEELPTIKALNALTLDVSNLGNH